MLVARQLKKPSSWSPVITAEADGLLVASVMKEIRGRLEVGVMRPGARMIWDYYHVPERFTYLRSYLGKAVGSKEAGAFTDWLAAKMLREFGAEMAGEPWVSCYISGCEQRAHTDTNECSLSYVVSLSDWDGRRYNGGETFFCYDILQAMGVDCTLFPDQVQPLLGRLLLLDGRVPHGVRRVDGEADPLWGRLVVHGMLKFVSCEICGEERRPLQPFLEVFKKMVELRASDEYCTGTLVCRIHRLVNGQATGEVLLNQVVSPVSKEYGALGVEVDVIQAIAEKLSLPSGFGMAIVPFRFGAT